MHAAHPEVGAGIAALALHALAELLEKCRSARLTRHQHILLRLGELIAYAECAGSLARRAARMAEGKLNEKPISALTPLPWLQSVVYSPAKPHSRLQTMECAGCAQPVG